VAVATLILRRKMIKNKAGKVFLTMFSHRFDQLILWSAATLVGLTLELGAATVSNLTVHGNPLLIPQVQKLETGPGQVSLPKVLTANLSTAAVNTENLEQALRKRGIALKDGNPAFLRLELRPEVLPGRPEGYRLEIKKDGILLTANHRAGLFYGLQTLADFVRNTAELPECRIEDYPDLGMRGVYLNVRGLQPEQVPAFKQVMTFLAGLKYNTLILEFADNFPLKSVKFNRSSTLTRDHILELKQHAEALHLEIIPLLQCLSHVLWMHGYADFDGILERRADGTLDKSWNTTWCPSQPQIQQLIAGVIRETAALLRPRYFHLGLDEVYLGPFHECEHCRKVPPEELFWRQVQILEKEAARNNVTPIFYHDIFLPQQMGGIKIDKVHGDKVIDRVPRKTVINVWDYDKNPRPAWTQFFTDRHFTVLGASYCENLLNTQTLPQEMAQTPAALGCILTYWHYVAGTLVKPDQDSNLAIAATILAADYSWNVHAVPLDKISFDPAYEYARRFGNAPDPFPNDNDKVSAINLAPQANCPFGADPAFPQFTPDALNQLAAELKALPEKFELLKDNRGHYYGIRLSGRKEDGREAVSRPIPVVGRASRLAFLMTAERPEEMDHFNRWNKVTWHPGIGHLTICYRDGSRAVIPLQYRSNIVDWTSDCGGYGCRVVNCGQDQRQKSYRLVVLDWINPRPEQPLASIVFSSSRLEGIAPVLLAIAKENSLR